MSLWFRSRIGMFLYASAGACLVMLGLYTLFLGRGADSAASRGGVLTLDERVQACVKEQAMATSGVGVSSGYLNSAEYDLSCARALYESEIKSDPRGNVFAWHQLGRIAFLESRFDDALYAFEKQKEYFGDTLPNVHYMVGLTYGYKARVTESRLDWKSAEEAFQTYITLDPLSPWARVDLAWVYFSQGKYEEMKKPLEEGMRHSPRNPWLLNMYGLALLNTDDKAGASQFFEQALIYAERLTDDEWGSSYPGNDPAIWEKGRLGFVASLQSNLALAHQYH